MIFVKAVQRKYEIVDGYHRIAAAKLRGDTKIKAYVPVG